MVSVAPPLLVSVTVSAALVVPNSWLPKLRLVAERVTFGGGEPVLTAASTLKMATTNRTRKPAQQRFWVPRRVRSNFIDRGVDSLSDRLAPTGYGIRPHPKLERGN